MASGTAVQCPGYHYANRLKLTQPLQCKWNTTKRVANCATRNDELFPVFN